LPPAPLGVPGTRASVVGCDGYGSGRAAHPVLARTLARLLGTTSRGIDADVERVAGKPILEILVDDGEQVFRTLEHEAVATALTSRDGVLALGGGAVLDPGTRAALVTYVEQGGVVVFLDVSLAQSSPRVGFNQSRPQLCNLRAQWQKLMTARRPVYRQVASLVVDTDGCTPTKVAREIADALSAGSPQGADGAR